MDFKEKRILGMIHLSGDDSIKISRALEEIAIYEEEGLYGCIIENYHGGVEEVEEVLKAIEAKDIKIKIGINILPNEYAKAFDLVNKYKIDFIQLDYVAGEYKNGIRLDSKNYLDLYWNFLTNKKVFILGGVWPKYYLPINGSNLEKDIEEALIMASGIVVTGSGTGKETPLDKIKIFREHMNKGTRGVDGRVTPLIIGAGLDASNIIQQLKFAEGAIVGSCFKPYKRTQEKVSRELVKEFMAEVKKLSNGFKHI